MPRILKRAGFCFHILDNYMVIFNINVEGHERIKDKDNWDMKRRELEEEQGILQGRLDSIVSKARKKPPLLMCC